MAEPLHHGGRLLEAAARYGIAPEQWLDLSTGINPNGWPVPAVPAEIWRRLPEGGDGLLEAAADYYGCAELLPVAGSQPAIQALPTLRPPRRVGLLRTAYAEHARAWQEAGHTPVWLEPDAIDAAVATLDALVLVHPNNPSGARYPRETLLAWHARLAARGGWLVVDEAFMDTTPGGSLAADAPRPGLILLRSLGKFFGLAGLRLGFVIAEAELRQALERRLGPWAVSHPARWVGARALADRSWQAATRLRLAADGERLAALLTLHGLAPAGGTPLFQWVRTPRAAWLFERLAREGILVRLFDAPAALRFGLPGDEAGWTRLGAALAAARQPAAMS